MEPTNLRFGGGSADTVLSPLVAVAVILAIILILFLPRRFAVGTLILSVFLVPVAQVIVLGGVHFTVMRILILAGVARWFIKGRRQSKGMFSGGFNSIDRVFVLFAFAGFITFSLEWMNVGAMITAAGTLLDCLGGYCILRSLIRNNQDVKRAIRVFAITACILGTCMLVERVFHQNIFASLGGGRGLVIEREGKIRAQATFETYLTAGAFGATLFPLLIWLWKDPKSKKVAYLGIAGATLMTLTPVSSTPLVAIAAGIAALCMWRFRGRMRAFRWGVVAVLAALQLVMKAPVWALIARIDLTGSSSGFHRFMLVDNLIHHFWDWWLVGCKNYDTWGWDMWDLSNQYVAFGLHGGLVTLALFIAIFSLCFAGLGRARKMAERKGTDAWFFWCLGATLAAHMITFIGVSYFDQMQFAWYFIVSIISVSIAPATRQPVENKAEKKWDTWLTDKPSYDAPAVLETQPSGNAKFE